MNGLVQRFDAEVGLQGVRDPLGQNLSSVPVHDRHQIEEPSAHGQIGDVRTPDLVRAIHPQTSQQAGIGLVTLRRPARVGLGISPMRRISRRIRFSFTRCPSFRKCQVIHWPSGYCRR